MGSTIPDAYSGSEDDDDLDDLPSLSPGDRFSRYRIERFIDKGAMSHVYEATHLELDKTVALKVLRADRSVSPKAKARFIREGRAASRLHHPGCTQIFDVGEHEGTRFLVMELLRGRTLEEYLTRNGALTVHESLSLIFPVLGAVQHAHDNGVLHRDLKPSNIFLADAGGGRSRPKILDFGISAFLDQPAESKLTMDSDIVGTPQYMAPEQARALPHDGRADQYALGVLVFECISGTVPHSFPSLVDLLHAVAYEPACRLSSVVPGIDPALDEVVARALAYEPEERFDSVRDFGIALLPFADATTQGFWREELLSAGKGTSSIPPASLSVGASTLPPGGPSQTLDTVQSMGRPKSRTLRWVLAALLLGIVGGVGFVVFSGAGERDRGVTEPHVGAAPSAPSTAEVAEQSAPVTTLNFRVEPRTASIFVDDERIGEGAVAHELAPRDVDYVVRIDHEGYESRTFAVPSQAIPRVVVLTPREVGARDEGVGEPPPPRTRPRPPRRERPRVVVMMQEPVGAAPPPAPANPEPPAMSGGIRLAR